MGRGIQFSHRIVDVSSSRCGIATESISTDDWKFNKVQCIDVVIIIARLMVYNWKWNGAFSYTFHGPFRSIYLSIDGTRRKKMKIEMYKWLYLVNALRLHCQLTIWYGMNLSCCSSSVFEKEEGKIVSQRYFVVLCTWNYGYGHDNQIISHLVNLCARFKVFRI